jgi:hypothetical protein
MFPYRDEEDELGDNGGPIDPAVIPPPEQQTPLGVAPIAPVAPMNPLVKDHLMQKFNLGDYSNENRQKLAEDSKLGFGDKFGGALAALGAGFSGKDAGAAGQGFLTNKLNQNKQALDDFDKARANKIQEYSLDRQLKKDTSDDEVLAREGDLNSQESKMANELATRMGYKGDPITAKQFK